MAFDKLKLVRTDSGMVPNAPAHFDYNLKTDEAITGAGYIPEDAGVKAGTLTLTAFVVADSGSSDSD